MRSEMAIPVRLTMEQCYSNGELLIITGPGNNPEGVKPRHATSVENKVTERSKYHESNGGNMKDGEPKNKQSRGQMELSPIEGSFRNEA